VCASGARGQPRGVAWTQPPPHARATRVRPPGERVGHDDARDAVHAVEGRHVRGRHRLQRPRPADGALPPDVRHEHERTRAGAPRRAARCAVRRRSRARSGRAGARRLLALRARAADGPPLGRPVAGVGDGPRVRPLPLRLPRRAETLLEGPSTAATTEVLPSIWRGEVAFVRVYHRREGRRGRLPYLYVRTLDDDATSRRQPGGARGSSGVPGPMALDLAGSRLAFTWIPPRGSAAATASAA
jgi:hypothetical protein